MNRKLLVCLGTEMELDHLMIKRIKKELLVDESYVVVGYYNELKLFEEDSCCIFRDDIIRGRYSKYNMLIKDGKLEALDDYILNQVIENVIQFLRQERRFEKRIQIRYPNSFDDYYFVVMEGIRYWYSFFIKNEITDLVLSDIPHECYDMVIYRIAKMLDISVTMCRVSLINHPTRVMIMDDFEINEYPIKAEILRLSNSEKRVELSDLSEDMRKHFLNMSSNEYEKVSINSSKGITRKSKFYGVFSHYYKDVEEIKCNLKSQMTGTEKISPWRIVKEYYNAVSLTWRERKETKGIIKKYNDQAIWPNYSHKYIYYAMHFIPEATSDPVGGVFYADQIIPIRILSEAIPEDWKLYVKIHPHQLSWCFNQHFFEQISELENVMLIREDVNQYELIKNSMAISSIAGTSIWEAMFFGIPALTFGYSELNSIPNSYFVRTIEDCKNVIENEIIKNHILSNSEIITVLKALENVTVPNKKDKLCDAIICNMRNAVTK